MFLDPADRSRVASRLHVVNSVRVLFFYWSILRSPTRCHLSKLRDSLESFGRRTSDALDARSHVPSICLCQYLRIAILENVTGCLKKVAASVSADEPFKAGHGLRYSLVCSVVTGLKLQVVWLCVICQHFLGWLAWHSCFARQPHACSGNRSELRQEAALP